MLEITPKIYAPSFGAYLIRRFKVGGGPSLRTLIISVFIAIAFSFVGLSFGRHELSGKGVGERLVGAIGYGISFHLIMIFIFIPAGYLFLWRSRWKYSDRCIVKKSILGEQEIEYRYLDSIALESKYAATLRFANPDGPFIKTAQWYGRDRKEWLDFIAFLSSKCSDVNGKTCYYYWRGFKYYEIKMSPEEAYDRAEKNFFEISQGKQ